VSRLGQAALVAAVPVAAVVIAAVGDVGVVTAIVLVLLVTTVWLLFVVQFLSGRTGRAFMAYGRLRLRALGGSHPDEGGRRASVGPPRRDDGRPKLAWSHDGWAHADGHLAGLEKLSEWFDITAFGCESRWRGEPPVALELLPARPYGPGLRLEGLETRLKEFDVVWAGGPYEGTTWQALDARRDGGPAVVSLEVENIVGNYVGPDHEIRQRPLNEVDHFCATSTAAAALLMLDGVEAERISLVPMAVDMPSLDARAEQDLREGGRRSRGVAQSDVLCVYIGRLIPDKGVESLIGALAWAQRWPGGERLRLVIAGEGESRLKLHQLAEHYGVNDRVSFAGQVGVDERRRLLAAADVLCLPSLAPPYWLEQFGRVMPEAFAFGVPVLGATSGSIPEVIGDAGLTYPPGDFGALADRLLAVTDDRRRDELSQRVRARAGLYSVEAFATSMRSALELGIARRAAVLGGERVVS
jgi:glycosyltransferase involved in cell wall biosynthesis